MHIPVFSRCVRNLRRWIFGIACLLSALSVLFCIGYNLTLEYYAGLMNSPQSVPPSFPTDLQMNGMFGHSDQPDPDGSGLPVLSNTASVFHILLIGTDADTPGAPCRSDAMILLSVNRHREKITVCSLLRDILVEIDGHAENKLNSAYSFGGTSLLFGTLRKNLNLDISYYVSVDLSSFARIIDLLGGLDVSLSAEEADVVNGICGKIGDSAFLIPLKSGTYHLNGAQALAHARDRSSANGDFDRTSRQRRLLQALFDKVKDASALELLNLLDAVLPYVSTNLTTADLKTVLSCLPEWTGYSVVPFSVPCGGTFSFDSVRGMSVIRIVRRENILYMYEQIYT